MINDNLDRSIRAIVGDARPTPEAEAAMDDAFAAIAQEAAARSAAPSPGRRRPAPVLVPRWARAAAVACAVCLGVGGTAYAADALGLINLQQSGDYQTLMTVNADEVAAPATGSVADYRLEFAKLPEGAAAFDRDDHLAKYDWADHEKGFSAFLFYLDSSEPLPVSFTTGATPVSVNGAEGVVFEKPDIAQGDHTLDMYLVFPDKQRVLWLWTDSLTADELTRIAEAACLIPTGTEVTPGSDGTLRAWSEEIAQARGAGEETETAEFKLDASAEEMSALHAAGETFAVPCFAEQTWGDADTSAGVLTATVTSVAVHDDLSTLDTAQVPDEWRALVGADGKLGEADINYVAWGDGRDRLDEVVSTESAPVKLVEATVEYRNTGSTALDDTLVYGSLMRAQKTGDTWSIFDRSDAVEGADDAVCATPGVTDGEMWYHAIDGAHAGEKNHLSHLAPGEAATVQLAWIVPADELDKLLLNLSGAGTYASFDESDLALGYVDIRQ
ncbi:hypothetical protein [Adlercreutzia equolifaciens]|uniref:hypothetical protein n=1 Tax=Adlercreutzia equolifaciens TaxID=446660 RepID=UPI0026DCB364|nr:hypothetical protein [Adlercreutzia equolifaciens]